MKGLPNICKPEISIRPHSSGNSSTPYRLSKQLAKPLSRKLRSISDAHLKKSGDLINKLGNMDFKDKIVASLDVQDLVINVYLEGVTETVQKVSRQHG